MRIGIDLGGTKIEGLVLGPDGDERARARTDTPQEDYEATVAAIAGLVGRLARQSGAGGDVPVGVGIPGAVSAKTGLIKNANSTCLIGQALGEDLGYATGRPVRLANDADCFTVAAATDGNGRVFDVVFGVILGTGCGGGVAVGGKLLQGPNAIAGEWGHNPLPWPQKLDGGEDERPGPECYCGQRGCIETFISGPGLERDYGQAAGKRLSAEDISALVEQGDANAEAALSRYEHRLARALSSVINVLDPGVIVLGGGLSNIAELYVNIPKLWGRWVFSNEVTTPLRRAKHGDSSGVRGAAWLWGT